MSANEMAGTGAGVSMRLEPPRGLEQIINVFGNIHQHIHEDGMLDTDWEKEFLRRATLPFPIVLSFDRTKSISQITCHKLLADIFAQVFAKIQAEGLQSKIKTFGGCFAFRPQRTSAKLSTHCWGIAIDLNPETNAQGTAGDMDAGVIDVFREAGFKWGGDWPGNAKDPMHFQFCTGY